MSLGKRSDRYVLGLFAHGDPADRYIDQGDDEAIFRYVIDELDEVFDGAASTHHIQHVVQNWTAEPFIRGSYSTRRASAKKMSAPLGDRVFFAGEAMNPTGRTIAVHGTSETAYLAVEAMLS